MVAVTPQKHSRLFILNEPNTLRISPALAEEIGLNESIVLLQIEFWISITNHEIDGRRWTHQSIREMQKKAFPFWSVSTIQRAIKNLLDAGYLIEGQFNKAKYDKTRWYALGERLLTLQSVRLDAGVETRSGQNETRSNQYETGSGQNETTIPEITTEITTETNTSNDVSSASPETSESVPYDEIITEYHKACPSLPRIRYLTDKRRRSIRSRWKKYKDLAVFTEVFKKAEASDFLSGRNGKWTSCNFDWLINEANMIKVLEGNYDNKGGGMSGPAPRAPSAGYRQGTRKSEYAGYIGSEYG